jgi:CPA2 family monovalent cation:H+ antiporter-2
MFERIKSDELFILFAMAIVFLSAALAQAFRVPAIIGAFFIGMVFADTKLAGRLKSKMESLRDAFVAMFFLSFGMLIDPGALPSVLPILLFAVALILMSDMFLTASLAYMIGFSSRAAMAIGTSFIARNEEAVLYATVGTRAIHNNSNLPNNYAGTYLAPFTGILCIVMSSLAPLLMVRSDRIARFFSKHLPKSITFGADLVKRTLRTVVLPSPLPIYRKRRWLQAALILYAAWIIDLTITHDLAHFAMALLSPLVIFAVYAAARRTFQEPVRHTNYGVDGGPFSRSTIETFVLRIVVGTLVTIALVAILWQYYWPVTLAVLYTYFLAVVFSMKVVYRRLGLGIGRRRQPVRILRGVPTARRGRAFGNGFGRR